MNTRVMDEYKNEEHRNGMNGTEVRKMSDHLPHNRIKRKMKTMSTKNKLIIGIRVSIILICSVGLIKQTYELIEQYNIGQTVVNINYENKNFNELPGLTVCYPAAISMAKMADKYQELKPYFKEYVQQIQTMPESERRVSQNLSQMYFNNFTKLLYHGEAYHKYNALMKDFFDVSIPYKIGSNGEPTIIVETFGIQSDGETNKDGIIDDNPIESIVFKHRNSWYKCFTFYSHLNEKWRTYKKVDISKIYIQMTYNEEWFPLYNLLNDGLYLSMHSPNELPRHDVEYYVELKANRYIKLTYNEWKTELLGDGYLTRCRNYNTKDKHFSDRMRSECIKDCIQQKLNECSDCNINYSSDEEKKKTCEKCISLTTALWTKNDFTDNPKIRICENSGLLSEEKAEQKSNCFSKTSLESENECQMKCRPKCCNRYFNYELKSISETESPNRNVTVITIQHNQLPDQITKHLPEMTFIQFISNFGGLLGMWLGLSALAIFKYVLKFFFK